jgi:hypothetical protein
MTKRDSNLQPDCTGNHGGVPIREGMAISHLTHGGGDHVTGHAVQGNIARDGAPKNVRAVPVHGGMAKQTKSGALARGRDQASAIDSLSGNVVVPGAPNVAQAGWGNSGIANNGHPLAKRPASKNLKPVSVTPGMRSRGVKARGPLPEIGASILAEAFRAAAPDDRMAHGRDKSGRK